MNWSWIAMCTSIHIVAFVLYTVVVMSVYTYVTYRDVELPLLCACHQTTEIYPCIYICLLFELFSV